MKPLSISWFVGLPSYQVSYFNYLLIQNRTIRSNHLQKLAAPAPKRPQEKTTETKNPSLDKLLAVCL